MWLRDWRKWEEELWDILASELLDSSPYPGSLLLSAMFIALQSEIVRNCFLLRKIFNLNPSLVDSSSNWSTSRACLSCSSLILSCLSCLNWELSSSIFWPSSARLTLTLSSSSRLSRDLWLSAAIRDLLWYAVSISSSLCSLSDNWFASCSWLSSSLI